ncbi:hypothetical protein [Actinomycetospora termitidis]|uniref:Uncharacterized protein n=1 Tax=Actinomycetospora termitidis TaxID=3053470 RepID=A0ABT7MEC4_9PSEU|nr:hypothetical protein [Actinomycetospora sp. Odt1-22]MDL5159009.1 hypothetical protein [Actinomycetospora sp. Odt1-22]
MQPQPPYGYRHQPFHPPSYPEPEHGSGAFRYVALACATVVAIGALVLAGMVLIPRDAAPVVVAGSSPVIAPVSSGSTMTVPAGGYACGLTGSGHAVVVENGTVPCDHAVEVAAMWLSTGTTPGGGLGSAGTMYSWTCSPRGDGGGRCTSKMGSHLAIGA